MDKTVLISATPFAEFSRHPMEQLVGHGLKPVISPYGSYATEEQSISLLTDAIGLIAGLEPLTRKVLTSSPRLKVISRVGIGLDNVDLQVAEELGIRVLNTPDAPTDAVAELTLGHILALLRHTAENDSSIKGGQWHQKAGSLLRGKNIAIIGLGRIGRRVVELIKPFHVRISAFDLAPPSPFIKEHEIICSGTISEMLPGADIVTLHIPYTKGADYIIGRKEMGLMKRTSILINCSRGHLIDESALLEALRDNRIAGAALDCFEAEPYRGPLTKLGPVILSPHVGSYTRETRIRMETEATENLIRNLKHG